MRKTLIAAASAFWPLAAVAAPVTITDTTDVRATTGGTPYNCCGFVNGWGDAVQEPSHPYNTDHITFNRVDGTHATIQLFTQFNGYQSIGNGKAVRYADLFIDTSTPQAMGGLTYGISLGFQGGAGGNSGLSAPGLYQITNSVLGTNNSNDQVKTSQDVWNGRGGWVIGGEFAAQNDHAHDYLAPTVLTGGVDQNWTVTVSETDPFGNAFASGPTAPVSTSGLYTLTVSLVAPNVSAMDLVLSDFDLYWGTGDCSNDAVWGIITGDNIRTNLIPTPAPPAILLFVSGLLFAARRKRRTR
jgi:hypothetical protein